MMDAQSDEMGEERGKVSQVVSEASKRVSKKVSEIVSTIAKVTKMSSKDGMTLEQKIMDVAERERMMVKRDILPYWGLLVNDPNRIHFLSNRALNMKFTDTPVYGTLIAAFAEQYVLNLLQEINNLDGRNLDYGGHAIDFKRPLYPGIKSDWNLIGVEDSDIGINLKISALDTKGKSIIECPEVNLKLSRPEIESKKVISLYSGDKLITKKKIAIEKEEREFFYECLGKKPKDEVAMMHTAASIPSALLDFLSQKTGKPEGGYEALKLEFYNQPNEGVFETTISISSEPFFRREMYHYTFEVLCVQEDNPIFGGQVKCYSPIEFKFE